MKSRLGSLVVLSALSVPVFLEVQILRYVAGFSFVAIAFISIIYGSFIKLKITNLFLYFIFNILLLLFYLFSKLMPSTMLISVLIGSSVFYFSTMLLGHDIRYLIKGTIVLLSAKMMITSILFFVVLYFGPQAQNSLLPVVQYPIAHHFYGAYYVPRIIDVTSILYPLVFFTVDVFHKKVRALKFLSLFAIFISGSIAVYLIFLLMFFMQRRSWSFLIIPLSCIALFSVDLGELLNAFGKVESISKKLDQYQILKLVSSLEYIGFGVDFDRLPYQINKGALLIENFYLLLFIWFGIFAFPIVGIIALVNLWVIITITGKKVIDERWFLMAFSLIMFISSASNLYLISGGFLTYVLYSYKFIFSHKKY